MGVGGWERYGTELLLVKWGLNLSEESNKSTRGLRRQKGTKIIQDICGKPWLGTEKSDYSPSPSSSVATQITGKSWNRWHYTDDSKLSSLFASANARLDDRSAYGIVNGELLVPRCRDF